MCRLGPKGRWWFSGTMSTPMQADPGSNPTTTSNLLPMLPGSSASGQFYIYSRWVSNIALEVALEHFYLNEFLVYSNNQRKFSVMYSLLSYVINLLYEVQDGVSRANFDQLHLRLFLWRIQTFTSFRQVFFASKGILLMQIGLAEPFHKAAWFPTSLEN